MAIWNVETIGNRSNNDKHKKLNNASIFIDGYVVNEITNCFCRKHHDTDGKSYYGGVRKS